MAKPRQVVEEQTVEKTVRSIAQAQAAYEKLMNEIREHCQQARDCGATRSRTGQKRK